jgi:hypothetical protein
MRFILIFPLLLTVLAVYGQPSKSEIIKYRIRSVLETHKSGSETFQKKIVYSINGHDSIISFDNQPAFYVKAKYDKTKRPLSLEYYNTRNQFEELLQFFYSPDNTYKVEIIAHGAGLISTDYYDSHHNMVKSLDSDDVTLEITYSILNRPEKIIRTMGKENPELVLLTKFDSKGLEIETEIFGEDASIIYYKHSNNGLITETRTVPKSVDEETLIITYEYGFF